jgi:hypothetical protein
MHHRRPLFERIRARRVSVRVSAADNKPERTPERIPGM